MTNKKTKKWPYVIGALVVAGGVMNLLGIGTEENEENTTLKTENRQEQSTVIKEVKENTEVTTEEQSKPKYDVVEMNTSIQESFNESVKFNNEGADGYEWTTYIKEIKLKENEALDVTVNSNFNSLDETQKTKVLNSVSKSVNATVYIKTEIDKPYFITAHDENGNKIAQSKMTNVLEYKFK